MWWCVGDNMTLQKRVSKLEQSTDPAPEFDASLLSDKELKFYDDTLTKAGYDWNKDGDLSLLSDKEIKELERITEKATA